MNKVYLLPAMLLRRRSLPRVFCARRSSSRTPTDFAAWEAKYSAKEAREFFEKFDRAGAKVRFSKDDTSGIGHIVVDNEGGKNALTGRMFVQLSDILDELEEWKAGRVVIVEGAKGSFCSGGDLHMMRKISNPFDGHTMNIFVGDILRRLRSTEVITVARVEGYALGGGAELAVACDLRALHEKAKIGYVQSRIAVTPGWGTTGRLFKMVGRENALKMLALGSIFDADEAKRIGLADMVFVDDKQFDDWIALFTKVDLNAMRCAKKLMIACDLDGDSGRRSMREREIFIETWGAPSHLKALSAPKKMK
uniref:Ethylmalonyl-CoA decarboxylase n=2 Tax=Parascaris TaxID=6254 RepID=A0A915B1V8_PARUN